MDEQAIKTIVESVLRNMQGSVACAQESKPVCPQGSDPIPVELSARHVHLSENDAMALFGAPLTSARELSQPGEFLANERVRLVGPKGVLDNVAILGPARKSSQIEISQTDARALGVKAPVRQSGDVDGSPGIILTSKSNLLALDKGVIVAARHIHMTPEDARKYCVADKDLVSVHINGDRPAILEDVLVRVSDKFKLSMHIDSDEGNSSGWNNSVTGTIVSRKHRQ